ncbi:septum formation family protein [Catellatospora sp. NPDC049609]|uniref:septum formation family protein n=1 Tax=Catellatospora sp. NPDC049609 TaxID=3155505 RepID=UPI0034260ACE
MRGRLLAGTVLAALLTNLALTGCAPGLPEQADGKLVDDWAPMAAATGWEPQVGECLGGAPVEVAMRSAPVVDCAETHYGEVVHVGRFTADAYPGPKQKAAALAECDTKAKAYLGRPWGDARLELRVSTPRTDTWESGARWFRCEVSEIKTYDDDSSFATRTGSLKGAVPAALLAGCVVVHEQGDDIAQMEDVPCSKPHHAEYVGVFRAAATAPYPTSERQWNTIHAGCQALKGKFLGVSASQARYYAGIASVRNESDWKSGDHAVRCAVSWDKKISKSVRGSKGKGIPN